MFKTPPFICRQHPAWLLLLAALVLWLAYAAAPARAAAPAKRIVSLAPALTEMLFALDLGPEVVGVSAYSDYPVEAKRKPVVSDATHLDEEQLIALKPDLIVAAEGDAARFARVGRLTGATVKVFPTHHVADVWSNLAALGALTGHQRQAAAATARLKQELAVLRPAKPSGRKVFYMVWDQPLMTAGRDSYLNDLIELAGAHNAATAQGSYPTYDWEAVIAANPDVILAPRTLARQLDAVARRYPTLAAVKAHRLRTLPDDLISRPGPRVAEALQALETALR